MSAPRQAPATMTELSIRRAKLTDTARLAALSDVQRLSGAVIGGCVPKS